MLWLRSHWGTWVLYTWHFLQYILIVLDGRCAYPLLLSGSQDRHLGELLNQMGKVVLEELG